MTNITVYDVEADALEKVAEANDTTVAEIIEVLVTDYLEEAKSDNDWN